MADHNSLLGDPADWGPFGSHGEDEACDRERVALVNHAIKRMKLADRKGSTSKDSTINFICGAAVGLAGVFIHSTDGSASDDMRDRFMALMQFAWIQASSVNVDGREH